MTKKKLRGSAPLPKPDTLEIMVKQMRDAIAIAGFQIQYATLTLGLIEQEMRMRGLK